MSRLSYRPLLVTLGLLVASTAGAQARQAGAPALSPELSAARSGLDKYRDPVAAVADGYLSTLGCMEYPKGVTEGHLTYKPGAMGVHFVNMGLVGHPLSPDKPQVLIYEPRGDRLELVAAEWFVPAEMVKGEKPRIFGQELEGPMSGHRPIMPEGLHHYDLHVWLWRENPNGTFHPTNSAVKCPSGARYTFTEDAPKAHHHKP